MIIKVTLAIGESRAIEEELELDDGLTEAEIDSYVEEWSKEWIELSWQKLEEEPDIRPLTAQEIAKKQYGYLMEFIKGTPEG